MRNVGLCSKNKKLKTALPKRRLEPGRLILRGAASDPNYRAPTDWLTAEKRPATGLLRALRRADSRCTVSARGNHRRWVHEPSGADSQHDDVAPEQFDEKHDYFPRSCVWLSHGNPAG
ncbi:hypothetical protein EYF80_041627 [Liparis tanakae]|uniref:Uncharacterized protein n=1 Tax=Liparis tanakae TaxID=230148 RepID=A0A4Z2G3L2_9TELE|nr:hypothetical protein EYF80_041627 [Liparis tanakae]